MCPAPQSNSVQRLQELSMKFNQKPRNMQKLNGVVSIVTCLAHDYYVFCFPFPFPKFCYITEIWSYSQKFYKTYELVHFLPFISLNSLKFVNTPDKFPNTVNLSGCFGGNYLKNYCDSFVCYNNRHKLIIFVVMTESYEVLYVITICMK